MKQRQQQQKYKKRGGREYPETTIFGDFLWKYAQKWTILVKIWPNLANFEPYLTKKIEKKIGKQLIKKGGLESTQRLPFFWCYIKICPKMVIFGPNLAKFDQFWAIFDQKNWKNAEKWKFSKMRAREYPETTIFQHWESKTPKNPYFYQNMG